MDRSETLKTGLAAFGLIASLMAAAGAQADPADVGKLDDVGVAGAVGTTGIGFHTTIPLRPNLNARLGMGYLGYTYSGRTRDMDYDLKLTANTYDALLDWYPSKDSAFRLTTGLSYNGNKIDVHARPNASGAYTIQGRSYDAASVGKVNGNVDFNKIAPYLGIGWGRPSTKEKGWSFSTDVGVMLQGAPKTSLSSSGCTASESVCREFSNDVARENAALRDEVNKFKVYPVLRVGISYKF